MTARSYQLTLEVLLESMSTLRETASLRASLLVLNAQQNGRRVEALAEIVVEHGRLVSCQLRALATGACLAQDEEASRLLAQAGSLEWQVVPRQTLSSVAEVGAALAPFPVTAFHHGELTIGQNDDMINAPKRVGEVGQAQLAGLPPRSRQAVLLSDGKRSCAEIARLLGMTPEHTERLLRWLSHQHLITWSSAS